MKRGAFPSTTQRYLANGVLVCSRVISDGTLYFCRIQRTAGWPANDQISEELVWRHCAKTHDNASASSGLTSVVTSWTGACKSNEASCANRIAGARSLH